SARGLLTQITSHGRPFPGLRAPAAPLSTPTRVSSSIPRGDVGDTAGRNTDQDGDLPVWIVLPPSGTGHSQGDREAVPDQGMPTHGSLSASESLYLGNRGSAWTCKVLALSPLVRLSHARSTSTAGIAGARVARTQPCVSIHQLGARGLDYFGPERSL